MEITNRHLAIVIIIALVLSLSGTIFSLSLITRSNQHMPIRGYIIRGEANLTADKVINLNLTNNFINFPAGYVANESDHAYLMTNKTCANWSTACTDVLAIVVENYGSVDINVTFNSTKNATGFLCNESGDCLDGTQRFMYWTNNTLGSSCSSGLIGSETAPVEVNNSNDISPMQGVCSSLQAGVDWGVYFNVALFVPRDVYGRKSVTLNFYSAESYLQG